MEMKVVGILGADEARIIAERARQNKEMKSISEQYLPELIFEIAKGISSSAADGYNEFDLDIEEEWHYTYDNTYHFVGRLRDIEYELLEMLSIAGYDVSINYNEDYATISVAW